MGFDSMQAIAREALSRSSSLGFEHLAITARWQQELGVRLAQSVVCRENVWRDHAMFSVMGIWQGRSSSFEREAANVAELTEAIHELRRLIEGQSADKESVPPQSPCGEFQWEPTRARLAELYGPEILYPMLEKHLAKVRAKGLRVTGYLEASEIIAHTFTLSGTSLKTRDTGITMTFTVDDGHAGAVGATQRAATQISPNDLSQLIGDALEEATHLAETSANPGEVEPGDYTVVLHPAAVLDLISMTLAYGLFDQRRIDEKRTYLSGKLNDLRFPEGLRLSQTLQLPLPDGGMYCDSPFNSRLIPCSSMTLIGDCKVQDLHLTPYWSKVLGKPETFPGYGGPPLLLEATAGSPLHGQYSTVKELIAGTKRGLYVANMWYLRMVAEMDGVLTGMTRDGLYEIKDGKLVRPIKHMRWHDNPFRILSAISGMSDKKMLLGRSRLAGRARAPMALMPAVRVDNFHFSSVTRF